MEGSCGGEVGGAVAVRHELRRGLVMRAEEGHASGPEPREMLAALLQTQELPLCVCGTRERGRGLGLESGCRTDLRHVLSTLLVHPGNQW